ncbi:MAG: major capsid protein, partial [Sneathiella sp.]
ARNARLKADEVQNIRAFGSTSEAEVALQEFDSRTAMRRLEMDLTLERMLLGAISGKVLDKDDSVIYNYFTEFKVSEPAAISMPFSTITQAKADDGILGKLTTSLKRRLKVSLAGMPLGNMQIHALCGDNFFDKLCYNAETRSPYKNWQASTQLQDQNLAHDTFKYGGVMWENYEGDSDGKVNVDTDSCRFVVKGVPGLFELYYAPADTFQFANTKGLPIYALPYRDPRDKYWEAEVQSNPLAMCTRPKSLERGIAA